MSQLQRKFIADNAVNGAKIRLENNESLRSRNAAGTGEVEILKVSTTDKVEFQSLPEALATLPIPSSAKQFATIEYIENYLAGKTDAKDAVSYLADANIAGTWADGTGSAPAVAATLTGAAALVIDGKTFGSGDVTTPKMRIALTGQTSGLQNGIYELTAAGTTSFTLTRAADFDGLSNASGSEVTTGAYFMVTSGTAYSGYEVLLTTIDPIIINTTALTFAKYPSTLALVGGDMISKSGNTFSVDLAPLGGLESTNSGAVDGQLRVKTDTAAAEKDQSTRRDSTSGAVVAVKQKKEAFMLTSTHITNGYVDLQVVAHTDSIQLAVAGAGEQCETDDYTVNYTGGASSKTRITFAGGLASGGVSALVAGDKITVYYESF